jgi:hypothetical protein
VVPAKSKARVLILARETVIAALLGMLLELDDYEPVFLAPDERPHDAISRVRPPLVIVLDGELDAASSDLFYARAAASRARVVLFSQPFAAGDVRAVAGERHLPFFELPVDRVALGRAMDVAYAALR